MLLFEYYYARFATIFLLRRALNQLQCYFSIFIVQSCFTCIHLLWTHYSVLENDQNIRRQINSDLITCITLHMVQSH